MFSGSVTNLADINCCWIAINCSLCHIMSSSKIWKKYFTVFWLNVKGPDDFILLEVNFEGERGNKSRRTWKIWYKIYTYHTGLSLNRHTRIMMWRSIETLLLFVAVGRKRLLEKWQDVLAEELLQNLCASFKGKEHSDGCFSLWKNLRVPSRFKVDADKYLWGIFTHTKDFWFSSLLFETPLCFSFMWEYTNNLCLLDVIFYFHNISWRSLQFSVIHHILNFISLYPFSFISLWYICIYINT